MLLRTIFFNLSLKLTLLLNFINHLAVFICFLFYRFWKFRLLWIIICFSINIFKPLEQIFAVWILNILAKPCNLGSLFYFVFERINFFFIVIFTVIFKVFQQRILGKNRWRELMLLTKFHPKCEHYFRTFIFRLHENHLSIILLNELARHQ